MTVRPHGSFLLLPPPPLFLLSYRAHAFSRCRPYLKTWTHRDSTIINFLDRNRKKKRKKIRSLYIYSRAHSCCDTELDNLSALLFFFFFNSYDTEKYTYLHFSYFFFLINNYLGNKNKVNL